MVREALRKTDEPEEVGMLFEVINVFSPSRSEKELGLILGGFTSVLILYAMHVGAPPVTWFADWQW